MNDPRVSHDGGSEPLVFGGRMLRRGDRVGPYVFEREVGGGGMARVLLARGPNGEPVALKVLRANRFDTGLARFRREFHALSRISHPNIIRVDAYGDLHGHPYIAMEYVDGPDLHTVVRSLRHATDEVRFQRVEDILVQLCRALAAIHRRGLVHRDLKPSNVLLTRDGVCKLTDFGIVKDLDPSNNPQLSTTLVGTWAYTSPEHIMGHAVDHRSDLYSLGVILFALLTGKRPFVADNMAGYLEMHRDRPAPRASAVREGVPEHLDAICARLLEKAPRDRFQSAREILYRLDADDPAPDVQNPRAWEPPFVGNAAALETVEEAIHALTGGRASVVRVVGEDGSGKSRLLEHAIDQARMLGLPFHHHAFRSDAPVFSVAVQLARELVRELPDGEGGDIRRLVMAWTEGSALRGDTRYALYDALREALGWALRDHPRLLLFDDVHEAAPQELDLVRYLARSLLDGAGQPLLVMLAGRRSAAAMEAVDVPVHEARLVPLTLADLRSLVGSLIGPGRAAEQIAQRLHAETEGNAFFATEFLRSLISRHIIVRTASGWKLALDAEELAQAHLEIPPGIRQMLRRRLDALPAPEVEVLEVLAFGGQPVSLDVLHAALGRPDEEELLQRLDHLIEAELVRELRRGDDLSYELVHRTISEIVGRDVPERTRREVHARLASAIEENSLHEAEALEVIGEHWRKAGEAGKAYENLVIAAARLVERSMAEPAWALSEKAAAVELPAQAELPAGTWAELRMEHLRTRAVALQNRGAWEEATAVTSELVAVAQDAGDDRSLCRARLERARVLRQRGERDLSRADAESALRLARKLHYRQGVAAALHNLAGLAWVDGDLDECEKLTHEGLLVAQGTPLAAERARLQLTYALSIGLRGQLSAAIRNLTEAEGLFRELRMQPQRVLSLANLSEMLVWQGESEDALRRADEAVRLAEALAYKLGLLVALRARGVARADMDEIVGARADLLRARAMAAEVDVHEEELAAAVALIRLTLACAD
ncbi:MAG TPA: protein kinase, partial [Myxococcota bacterium]|nr:protein kinase [Myxococcota bacterium]